MQIKAPFQSLLNIGQWQEGNEKKKKTLQERQKYPADQHLTRAHGTRHFLFPLTFQRCLFFFFLPFLTGWGLICHAFIPTFPSEVDRRMQEKLLKSFVQWGIALENLFCCALKIKVQWRMTSVSPLAIMTLAPLWPLNSSVKKHSKSKGSSH